MNCYCCQEPFLEGLLFIYECGHITCECYPSQNHCHCGEHSPSVRIGRVDSKILELLQDEDPVVSILLHWNGNKLVSDAFERNRKRARDLEELVQQRADVESAKRRESGEEYKKLYEAYRALQAKMEKLDAKAMAEKRKTAEEQMRERKEKRDIELRRAKLAAGLAKAEQGRIQAELEDRQRELARAREKNDFLIECVKKLTARVEELTARVEELTARIEELQKI